MYCFSAFLTILFTLGVIQALSLSLSPSLSFSLSLVTEFGVCKYVNTTHEEITEFGDGDDDDGVFL